MSFNPARQWSLVVEDIVTCQECGDDFLHFMNAPSTCTNPQCARFHRYVMWHWGQNKAVSNPVSEQHQ